jgi:3,5-epimerase/4-reductase
MGLSPPNDCTEGTEVLIFGSRGYLGHHFLALFPAASTPRIDIGDAPAVRQVLEEPGVRTVINCAGRCGSPNVEWCEDHKAETVHSNVLGPLVLLEECMRKDIYFVHISSGCLYSGDNRGRGYSEEHPPNFAGSFYARTKAWAEQALREFPVLILRPRMPFDGSTSERNLIMKLRGYRRVLVEQNSLTHVPDLLHAARVLIERRATGVFNVVNPGTLSPFEVMQMYRELVDPTHAFEPLPLERLGEVARTGRSSCVLSTARLEREGIRLPPVRRPLETALRSLADKLASERRTRDTPGRSRGYLGAPLRPASAN